MNKHNHGEQSADFSRLIEDQYAHDVFPPPDIERVGPLDDVIDLEQGLGMTIARRKFGGDVLDICSTLGDDGLMTTVFTFDGGTSHEERVTLVEQPDDSRILMHDQDGVIRANIHDTVGNSIAAEVKPSLDEQRLRDTPFSEPFHPHLDDDEQNNN